MKPHKNIICLLSMAICFLIGHATQLTSYEYWIDDGYESRKTFNASSEELISASVNLNDAGCGVHFFNIRIANSDKEVTSPIRYLFYIPEEFGPEGSLSGYEYWLDDNYDSRVTSAEIGEEHSFLINLGGLKTGVHFLNYRAFTDTGSIGSPVRYLFYIPEEFGPKGTLSGYEYWLDDDYDSRVTSAETGEEHSFLVNLSGLNTGVHFLNYRAFTDTGSIGSPVRYLFYIPEEFGPEGTLSGCEYWLDDDYDAKVTSAETGEEHSFLVNLNGLNTGVHFLNYRAFTDTGSIGSPIRYLFYIPEEFGPEGTLAGYEYWLDDGYDSRITVSGSNEDQVFMVDLRGVQSGVHFLNYRAFTDNGNVCSPVRYLFYIPDNTASEGNSIIGYEYSFNDISKFVPLAPCNEYEMNAVSIPLPDVKDAAKITPDCSFTFSDGMVTMSQNANICFLLRFMNSGGEISMPICHEYQEKYSISKAPIELKLQKSVLLDKVPSGDFQAVRFDIPSRGVYYLRATQACDMYILDDAGRIIANIGSEALFKTYALSVTEGTYYGIVFNTTTNAENQEKQVGIRLMATNNSVPTPEISYENETVSITCLQEDAAIYYTLDGSMPDENSNRYTAPFKLNHNAEIKAIAKAADYADSFIAYLKVDSYKVATPVIQFANLKIYITCPTPESKIYYTIDGSDPSKNGQLYNAAVPMVTNCTVKAVAKRDHYNDSDVAEFILDISNVKCGVPTLTINGNLLTMSTISTGASIYYTTDGSVPNNKSILYKSPILLDHNCIYRAVAVKSGEIDSDIAELTVDWFNAEMPEFSFENGQLTITCKTQGSTIFYEIGGKDPTVNSQRYVSPISLTDNRIVKAFAVADGFNDSEIVSYSPSSFTCAQPSVSFDGRSITLSTSTENATIYYTIDGTNPGTESNIYSSKVILPGLCTVKAITVRESMNNSQVLTFTLPCYYNGGDVLVSEPGSLSKAFEWCSGVVAGESLRIEGKLGESDFKCIRGFGMLRHLDLSAVSLSKVPDKAFEKMSLLTLKMPEMNFSAGSKLLSGCSDIAAIIWNSNTEIPLDIFDGMNLPNLLLYVKYAAVANADFNNIIVDDVADMINLSDSESSNFYCPQPFTARKISYTHNYSQKSGYDRCAGWESIALPFAPTSISHEIRGPMSPFAAGDSDKKQFWLCELTSTGFVSATSIEANTPYIIAMPNNDNYSDEYILQGNVTFSGNNVTVQPSDEIVVSSKGDKLFLPNFTVTKKEKCMALNVGEVYNGHAEGSLFALGLRDVRPFEAYVTNSAASASPSRVFRISFDSDDIQMNPDFDSMKICSDGSLLSFSGLRHGDVIDIVGIEGLHILRKEATDESMVIEKPVYGPVVISISRDGRCIKQVKFIL